MSTETHLDNDRPLQRKRLTRYASNALILILPLAAWMLWMGAFFNQLNTRPALDNAQAARHLAQGDGWITSVIRPLSFAAVPRLEQHPDLFNPPLFKLITASLFKLGGAKESMAALASGWGWIVCGWLIYVMTVDLTGKPRSGWMALILWLVHTQGGRYGIMAQHITWSAALVTGIIWTCLRARMHRAGMPEIIQDPETALRILPVSWAVASGVLAGLLVLMEPGLMWIGWLPLIVHWICWPYREGLPSLTSHPSGSIRQRSAIKEKAGYALRLAPAFLIPAFCIAIPWFLTVRSLVGPEFATGLRLYQAMINSPGYPGDAVWRYVVPPTETPWSFWLFEWQTVLRESAKALLPMPEMLFRMVGLVPSMLLLASFLAGSSPGIRVVRSLMTGMFLSAIVFFNLLSMNFDMMLVFVPAILALGITGLDRLSDRWLRPQVTPSRRRDPSSSPGVMAHIRRPLASAAIVMMATLPLVNLRFNRPPVSGNASRIPPGLAYIRENGNTSDTLLSDAPWLVAWRGERKAVWLPQREIDFDKMMESGAVLDWVYLIYPRRLVDDPGAGDWWPDIVRENNWQNFRPVEAKSNREFILRAKQP